MNAIIKANELDTRETNTTTKGRDFKSATKIMKRNNTTNTSLTTEDVYTRVATNKKRSDKKDPEESKETINETGLATECDDDKIVANKNHLTPSLPLGGESRAAKGCANLQVEILPIIHMESTHNNPCLACNQNETKKAAKLTAKEGTNMDLAIITIRTNTTPRPTKA